MSRLAIFGSGGFGREVFAFARIQETRAIVFVTDSPGGRCLGSDVVASSALDEQDEMVIAVGSTTDRLAIAERLQVHFATLVARQSFIGPDVRIGEGSIFCPFSSVTASATIGRHFHCNVYSYVAHDCVIGDFVTFAPQVGCNGRVSIGNGAYLGTGAIVKPGVRIGAGAIIGMGAVVVKDVEPGTTVVGNPARPIP